MTVDVDSFVLGGRGGLRGTTVAHRKVWAGIAFIAVLVIAPLRGLYRFTGGTMEEGFMLYFPELLRDGKVPNVDFLHLYGPGALHVLAGVYTVFDDTLEVERTFGLLQHVAIIAALFTLARPWGRFAATAVGTLGVFYILTPIGLTAMAWNGGIALLMWAAVFAVRSRFVATDRIRWQLLIAGALSGLALTYRPDLIIAVGGLAVWLVGWPRARRRSTALALGGGAVIGLIPMWVHLLMAGPSASWRGMVTDPVFELRAGRELPRPPSWNYLDGALQRIAETVPPWWPFPALPADHAIFLWFFAMLLTPVAFAGLLWWLHRRGVTGARFHVLVAVAITSTGIIPQGLQRPDSTHLTWVTCLSWPFLVVAVAEVVRGMRPRWTARQTVASGLAVALAVTFVLTSLFTFRYYALHTRVGLGMVPSAFEVSRGDRRFFFGAWEAAQASQEVINDLDRLSQPGESLLVGPQDLRRTWYSDAIFYWMFPELEPATYFIEMDPGLADEPGSGLADDVRSADWVLLTSFWAGWDEPNASMEFGDPLPNEIVATEFCVVGDYWGGLVRLYAPLTSPHCVAEGV